jgi:SsrA-binding protein
MEKKKVFQTIVNKKALFDYQVLDSLEAGVELTGPEAKSVRLGQVSLKESYVALTQRGLDLLNVTITPYKYARTEDVESKRTRRLLVHKTEMERLRGVVQQKGVTLVPLKIYLKHGKFKVQVGIVRGKKQFEKREAIKRRDLDREAKRDMGY